MISTTWNWMWEKHHQAKDMLRFFAKPGSTTQPDDRDRAEDAGTYDERFKNNIDKAGEGTAEFVSEAIKIYCK